MKQSTCQQCSKLFAVTCGSLGKFCSLSCGTAFRNKRNSEKAIIKYELNPVKCKCCHIPLLYNKRKNTYCSSSCAAKISNLILTRKRGPTAVEKSITNLISTRKRGPAAVEKSPFSRIKFILCTHTNQFYSNKNPDGTTRRCSPYIKTIKEQYYAATRFKFNVYHYPEEFDLSLIEQHGWYTCPGLKRKGKLKNIAGVSRDHIMSVSYGFSNNIDPKFLAHPANCRIMLHSENKIKHGNCDITLLQLLEKIKLWNQKHTEQVTGIEPATNRLEI